MEWQHPQALYLILPLCTAWLVLTLHSHRRRRVARTTFAAPAMWSRIFPAESRGRFWVKFGLRELAIVTGLIALAGPRFGTQYEQVVPRGSDLYVLVDVSRSMLADDVPPSRLGRAKTDVAALVNRLEGERVGLIAFAGQAVVKCPLTVDYDSFRRSLDELDPDSAPRGGTAIGDAIRKALEVFHAKTDRDQAILLITDGDDQQSYPLEAAEVAAERHVTIFTVGLGDTDRGARIPQKSDSKSFIEYQGTQVWSKLDGNLLQQIALKTNGVYVPAGTRAYDLSELYANHLQGRLGDDSTAQQRIRRSERFQWFLAISLAALLIDLCIVPFRRSEQTSPLSREQVEKSSARKKNSASTANRFSGPISQIALIALGLFQGTAFATEPTVSIRDGLRLYSKDQFEEAREKFAAASEELDKQKSAAAAIAAFDEACALHRKGDLESARESYLRAGLSQDRSIAIAAHFNLGTLQSEKARTLSGDKPETVPADKRQEILDQLAQSIVAYRHCLELRPDHAPSRRNLELVRQWIKHYTDRWHELDRQKRRDESNLFAFLEFMIQTQSALRETLNQLPNSASSDAFAEIRRAQEELREEIPTLREKIADELRPQPQQGASKAAQTDSNEVEEGIALLREWADNAGKRMSAASDCLRAKEQSNTATEQQAAIDELDRIWEAIVPFHPLLSKLVADQTSIAKAVTANRNPSSQEMPSNEDVSIVETGDAPSLTNEPSVNNESPQLEIADDDFRQWEESQVRTLKRTRLLAPKAEAELSRLDASPSATVPKQEDKSDADKSEDDEAVRTKESATVDPEQIKAGLRKAIELAPKAVEQMDAAVKALRQKDREAAAAPTEAARKILEEIQDAQPKNNQKQDQQNQKDEKDQKQDPKKGEDKKDQQDQNGDEDKKQEQKSNDKKKDEEQSKDDLQSQNDKQKQQTQRSQDRVEDALRKVRERQQEKRERDRKLKGQFFGKTPVDKDW